MRRRELQVEGARARDLDRALDRARPAREPAQLLGGAAQVRERPGRQPTVDLVERAAGTHRGERGRERTARGRGVVHVVRRDHLDAGPQRDLRERVVAMPVERIAVIPQLDEHAIATERVDQLAPAPCAAAAGPSRCSAAGTVPLRQPVSTNQWSFSRAGTLPARCTGARAASASCASDVRGAPFSPASCASLIALASRAYPTGPCASTIRCSPGGSAIAVRAGSVAPRVSSVPNTVGRPSGRAASAKRTTP